ncbi:MAG: methyltransferase domain-containing protein [Patescibacteria group bacterium]
MSYKKIKIPCNLCGGNDLKILAVEDHIGQDARTCICKKCGLIFINPRMNDEFYKKYYGESLYREYKNIKRDSIDSKIVNSFNKGFRHGEAIADIFGKSLLPGLTIEIGSSSGGVLFGLHNKTGLEVLGIEPSKFESDYANHRGIKTFCGLIEDVGEDFPIASNIICSQSLNHFLDPKLFFRWIYNHLIDNGRIFIEVKNFRFQAKKAGSLESAIQIDHSYMFLPEVLENFVKSAGFQILCIDDDEKKSIKSLNKQKAQMPATHFRILAEKTKNKPFENIIIRNNYIKNIFFLNNIYMKICNVFYRLRKHFAVKFNMF